MIMRSIFVAAALAAAVLTPPREAWAQEQTYRVTIKDHKFEPAELEVPANTKFKLIVKNLDPTPEEFEMSNPTREKVVKGGQEGTVNLGPFAPGAYEFFGDFNPKTARGRIVAK
jgi:hypothetical protein